MASWLARGLMLLCVILLIAGPVTPAAAAPMDCCPDAACHDAPLHDMGKTLCPQACAIACQALAAPDLMLSAPIRRDEPIIAPSITRLPPGRAVAPDLPPPR